MPPKVNSRVRKQDEFQTVQEVKRTPKCRAQMSLPSSDAGKLVIFKCNETKEHSLMHTETGRVKLRNGKTFEYDITWMESQTPEVWREEQPTLADAISDASEALRELNKLASSAETQRTPEQRAREDERKKVIAEELEKHREQNAAKSLLVAASGTSTTTEDSANANADTNER